MSTQFFTLDELTDMVSSRLGSKCLYTWRDFPDGSSHHIATINGEVRASWVARLKNSTPIDGKTPRGPKEYYGLKFY